MNKTIVVQAHFITYEMEEYRIIYNESFGNKIKNFFLKRGNLT